MNSCTPINTSFLSEDSGLKSSDSSDDCIVIKKKRFKQYIRSDSSDDEENGSDAPRVPVSTITLDSESSDNSDDDHRELTPEEVHDDEYESTEDDGFLSEEDENDFIEDSSKSSDEDNLVSLDDKLSEKSENDSDDLRELRLQRKRCRNTNLIFPRERDRKMAREEQMSLLKQRRSRFLNRKKTRTESKRGRKRQCENLSQSSSDESVVVVHQQKEKKKPPVYDITSDESANDDRDRSQPTKRIESEDDEIGRSEFMQKWCKNVNTLTDDELSNEEEEKTRKKRLAEKQALFDSIEAQDILDPVRKLVLDYDAETKEELVVVDANLSEKLKPHQREGVKFMWNSCFESVKQLQKGRGGGCILAHCMGLGKTLQVITLVHTLLTHEVTKVKSVLVLCPVSTILNWVSEFEQWLTGLDDKKIKIYNLTKLKKTEMRLESLETWVEKGGVMIIGYEMFRLLLNNKQLKKVIRKRILRTLLHPGCDLVICDEGHVLKNEKTALAKTMMKMQTRRRIVLTGTPLQNNLMEYYCMVHFAKPGLLGSKKNFQNRFGHPITNGQFQNSDDLHVSIMKQSAYILNKLLSGIVQRRDHNTLKPYLPPKREFVILVGLSDIQVKLYKHYLGTQSMIAPSYRRKDMKLLADFQKMRLIWTHPLAIRFSEERYEPKRRLKPRNGPLMTDEENSDISDTYGAESDDSVMSASSNNNGRKMKTRKRKCKRKRSCKKTPEATSQMRRLMHLFSSDDESQQAGSKKLPKTKFVSSDEEIEEVKSTKRQRVGVEDDLSWFNDSDGDPISGSDELSSSTRSPNNESLEEEEQPWYHELLSNIDIEDHENGPKVTLLFALLKECKKIGDKVLVFSQSLASLDVIEHFLKKSDEFAGTLSQKSSSSTELNDFVGEWDKGFDYFRLDGKTSKEDRAKYCEVFNDRENKRARLFLISTKAGGLGINLTAANRVVVFDSSWNPSSDIQSIFRIYRFGQTKPSYVYRFISQATMEEKIYGRQVTKLSIARRVIDEEQIDRHFTREQVGDLYAFDRIEPMIDESVAKSVDDNLMAGLLRKYSDIIINLHEHDSFLENNEEEELTEEERRTAEEELNRSRSEEANRREKETCDIKEKIRSTLTQINSSANESDIDVLYQKLVEYYKEERRKRLQLYHSGVGAPNPFKKSIPTDEHAVRNGGIVYNFDGHRPIFGMGIGKATEEFQDLEMLAIKQRALLHILRTQPTLDAKKPSTSNSIPKICVTWVLKCAGKDAAELETIFRTEFEHWYRLPIFSKVEPNLLVHFDIGIRRVTLEEKLDKYGITMTVVKPDFETAESLLGSSFFRRTEKEDILSDDEDEDGSIVDDEEAYDSEDERPRNRKNYNEEYYDSDEARKITKSFLKW